MKNDILIDGKDYKLWREGKYLGVATYHEHDPNIGESFQKPIIHNGTSVQSVFIADEWELTSPNDII
jgi:hypothetical protein